jgi:hypothetical protein
LAVVTLGELDVPYVVKAIFHRTKD